MVIEIDAKEWTDIFIKDINDKISEAKVEYAHFKDSSRVVFLQQAGNKLFSAVENYLMLKYKTRVKSYQQLRSLVKNSVEDRNLLSKVVQLHYFFSQSTIMGEIEDFEDLFIQSLPELESRLSVLLEIK